MAPKRQKKQKERRVRHHQEIARSGDEIAPTSDVENLWDSVDTTVANSAAPVADSESRPTATEAPEHAPAALEDAPHGVPGNATSNPALDIWPDFEEVVFPAVERRPDQPSARGTDQAPPAGDDQAADVPPTPAPSGEAVDDDEDPDGDPAAIPVPPADAIVDDDDDDDPDADATTPRATDDAGTNGDASAGGYRFDVIRSGYERFTERRRTTRPGPTEDGAYSALEVASSDEAWRVAAPARLDESAAFAGMIADDLDEDEREALRLERLDQEARVVGDDAGVAEVDSDVDADVDIGLSAEPDADGLVGTRGRPILLRRRGSADTRSWRVWSRPRPAWADGPLARWMRGPLRRSEVFAMLGAIALAIALWVPAMRSVRLANMDDLGLVSALPALAVVPFALLIASFVYCLWRAESKTLLLGLHTVALIVMVYAVRALYVAVPSFKVTYRHVGVADVIGRTGSVDSSIDAYFNWPGFFTYTESLAKAVGFGTIEAFANLAPMVFNLLYLAPLLVIMRMVTTDRRLVWLGIWTFYLSNWVAQDYLSPQGLGFFLHLVVIAIVLRWFTRPRRGGAEQAPSGSAVAALAVALVLMAYLIPTHQLTPFATIFALFAILSTRRMVSRTIPILVAVMAATWLVLMATAYLSGHQSNITGGIGDVGGTVSSNVGDRVVGSAQRVFVNQTRIWFTLTIWVLTLVGGFRLFRARRLDPIHLLIPASAFALIPIQSYGGEVVFRVFLFALPFVAALAAVAVMPRRGGRFAFAGPLVAAAWLAILLGSLLITRYGNERMDTYTKNEVAATQFLYNAPGLAGADRRSMLAVGGSDNLPWKARFYDTYQWKTLQQLEEWKAMAPTRRIDPRTIVNAVQDLMRHYPNGAYLIFTRSQAAEIDLVGSAPRGSVQAVERAVADSSLFRRVFHNDDANIYALTPAGLTKRTPVGS